MDADSSDRWFILICNAVTNSSEGFQLKIILYIITLTIMILINALLSASEMALISVNRNKIRQQSEEGNKRSIRILKFLNKPTVFLSTIQLGLTFVGFLASALTANKLSAPLTIWLKNNSINFPGLEALITIALTAILSFITIIFGELVPKRIAMYSPENVLKYTTGFLTLIGLILKPFVSLLTFSTSLALKAFGIKGDGYDKIVTEEEIRMLVNEGQETGVIHEDEKEMIENIFELDDTVLSEIMTHRTNVVALELDTSFDEVLAVAVNEKFTRIPVFKDSIDNIVGIIHTKDLLTIAIEGLKTPFSLDNILREAFFLPETKTVNTAFREMQRARAQLAVVIDEYGGTAGIITMEDILEEIVGNMQDEYDDEQEEIVRIDDNTFIVDGVTPLDELSEEIDVEFDEDRDYDTVAGLVLDALGRIPEEGEQPEVMYENLKFTVNKMTDKRISEIRIDILPLESDEEDDDDGKNKEEKDDDNDNTDRTKDKHKDKSKDKN